MGKPSPRVDDLEIRLREICAELAPGDRLPKVRELQTRFGVSLATLDRALRRLVSCGLVARRHGSGLYVADEAGKRRIAMLFAPRFFRTVSTSAFWPLLISEAERRCVARGYGFQLHLAVPGEAAETEDGSFAPSLAREIRAGRVDGVLSVGVLHRYARWIEAEGIPVASYAEASRHIVGIDFDRFTDRLIDGLLAAGIRTVTFIGRDTDDPVAFLDQAARRGLVPVPPPPLEGDPAERGEAAAESVETDGVLAIDDVLAHHFLIGIRKRERPPLVASLSVVGSPMLRPWEGEIVTAALDPGDLVERMLEALDAVFEGTVLGGAWRPDQVDPTLLRSLVGPHE